MKPITYYILSNCKSLAHRKVKSIWRYDANAAWISSVTVRHADGEEHPNQPGAILFDRGRPGQPLRASDCVSEISSFTANHICRVVWKKPFIKK